MNFLILGMIITTFLAIVFGVLALSFLMVFMRAAIEEWHVRGWRLIMKGIGTFLLFGILMVIDIFIGEICWIHFSHLK